MQKLSVYTWLFLGAALLPACDPPSSAPGAPAASLAPSGSAAAADGDVLVTVNGVPIRVPDLHFILAREDRGRGRGADAAKAKAALEKIIERELTRQQAEAMQLDQSPDYLRKLRFMEAPLNDFKRTTLTEMYFRKEIAEKSKVDDAEARKYFDDNSARFKTEVQVFQIMVRNDDAKITEMKKELDEGAPFEEVAAKLFPAELPKSDRVPWDLGLLRWNQVPPPWQDALAKMKEGDVSEILHGAKKRAWIIKLVKRQVNDAITFDQVKTELIETLQAEKVDGLGQKIAKELRSKASIVYVREPGEMPPPPEPED